MEKKRGKKIFLLRHADYLSGVGVENPGLSSYGEKQAKSLSDKIKANLNGDDENITIWTSSANRAKETALIIKENFPNAEFIENEKLWSDNKHLPDFNWLEQELKSFYGNTLIIISHLEYIQDFPATIGFSESDADYAEGVLIENDKCVDFG